MYRDLLPFVNDDEFALTFIRYNYIGEEFALPINREEMPDTIKGEAVFQLMLEKNYNDVADNNIAHNFIIMIRKLGDWHRKIDGKLVTDVNAKKIYEKVYLRWKELSPLARKFYSTHLYLTKTENGKDIIIRDFDNLAIYNPVTIKLHLRRAKDGKVLFRHTLPFLPKSDITVNNNGTPFLDKTYLRRFYDSRGVAEYNANTLNYSKFIQNVIKNSGKNVDLYKYVPSSVETLENLYPEEPELAQLNFTRDVDGVLVRNGERLDDDKLELDLAEAGVCYGTGIKRNSSIGACSDVYKCLLDVKPGDISRCAAELENEDLFEVDAMTIQNINPKIMKLILQNLGVKISKEFGSSVCESFESWLSRTPIRNVVIKNKNLSRYIRTIINVIRSNPLILNPAPSKNLYGLTTFKTPETLQNRSRKSESLADMLLYTKNFSGGNINTSYPDNLRFIMPNMSGGDGEYSENAAQIKKLFDVLFAELDKAGVPLVENDQKRIYDTINRMSKLELDVPRLLEDLRVYTDLIKLIDEKEKNETKLDDFRDIRNNKTQLTELVNKVNKKIQANINRQNLIFQVLYNKVQIPLLARLVF